MTPMRSITIIAWLLAAVCAGCEPDPGWHAPSLSVSVFEKEVYPVLIRDCAFHACHGSETRFFRVWGPGRARFTPTLTTAFDPVTQEEKTESYQRALSMVDPNHPSESLLLRKPLATAAGGAGHLGADKFGRNVYRTVDDAGYLVLSQWVYAVGK